METLIFICLLIIIILLLQDKLVIKWKSDTKPAPEKVDPKLPDIMGRPKSKRFRSRSNTATKCYVKNPEISPDNFEIEYDSNEILGVQIPPKELDKVLGTMTDLEEEEEEWKGYGISGGPVGFAQGVTFEELSSVGILLQKERLELPQKEMALAIVQKLQGTELFALMESSMVDASRKIAKLLDGTLSAGMNASSSTLCKSGLEDFDIGDFV